MSIISPVRKSSMYMVPASPDRPSCEHQGMGPGVNGMAGFRSRKSNGPCMHDSMGHASAPHA